MGIDRLKRHVIRNFRRATCTLKPVRHDRKVDFVIAGTQKGGTTSLFEYVSRHPNICTSCVKEVHFFDNDRLFSPEFNQSPDYRKYHRHFHPLPRHHVLGEATPIYMYWPQAVERIHRYESAMKLILVLRDPAERAFSHWRMELRRGRTRTAPFGAALREELVALESDASFRHRTLSYVARGRYAQQIRHIYTHFPPQQVLVTRSEDLLRSPQGVLDLMYDFLGVDRIPLVARVKENAAPDGARMNRNDRAMLVDLLGDDIRDLESLLGWDCSAWLEH